MEENEKSSEDTAPGSSSSWWNSWYDTAKKKLEETNNFVMKDVKEFGSVVRNESSSLVASAATSMKEQLNISVNIDEASEATKYVASSISGFLGSVVKHVTPILPDSDEDDDSSMVIGTMSGVKMMSPSQTRLYNIQTDPATYCNEPDNLEEFHQWLPTFMIEDKKEELSTLMLDSKEVRSIYTKLVPEAVSHKDFWTRYFYKKHVHDEAEKRRALLVERAQQDTELSWEDDDDSSDETQESTAVTDVAAPPSSSIPTTTTTPKDVTITRQTEQTTAPQAPQEGKELQQESSSIVPATAAVVAAAVATVAVVEVVSEGSEETNNIAETSPTPCATSITEASSPVPEVPSLEPELSPVTDVNPSSEITAVSEVSSDAKISPVSEIASEQEGETTVVPSKDSVEEEPACHQTTSDESNTVNSANDPVESTSVVQKEIAADKAAPSDDIKESDKAATDSTDIKDSVSGGSTDSWEKEFNLDDMVDDGLEDMTEEEIKEALAQTDDLDDDDDWETWE